MGKPIAVAKDLALAFPNVCLTTIPGVGPVPIPYPSIADLGGATLISDESGKELLVGGVHVLLEDSEVESTSGDEPADPSPSSGVSSGNQSGPSTHSEFSGSVFYNGRGIVRFLDQTEQNKNGNTSNATGMVLSADPSVLVGD